MGSLIGEEVALLLGEAHFISYCVAWKVLASPEPTILEMMLVFPHSKMICYPMRQLNYIVLYRDWTKKETENTIFVSFVFSIFGLVILQNDMFRLAE